VKPITTRWSFAQCTEEVWLPEFNAPSPGAVLVTRFRGEPDGAICARLGYSESDARTLVEYLNSRSLSCAPNT
jgi:hypothetical protein